MKVLSLSLLCALGAVAHASLPVASLYKTIIPGQTKSFGYSTTQYINTIPASYSVGLHPQLTYQFPQYTSFGPQQTYYTIPGGSTYFSSFPVTSFYPGAGSIAPVASTPTVIGTPSFPTLLPAAPSAPQPGAIPPGFPAQQPTPSAPSQQPSEDSDTAVVDSVDFPNQQQESSTESKPNAPQFPFSSQFPNYPQTLQEFPAIPQVPQGSGSPPSLPQAPTNPQESGQGPSFPQIPQFPQGSEQSPSFPQIPQGSEEPSFPQIPQIPQGSQGPSFPQIPQFPQGSEGPSFPQIPQFPQGSEGPSFPQIPQFPQGSEPSFPQFPQGSPPGFPQFPSFPSAPTPSPPSSYPGADNQSKGFDDEDTISVESA